MPTNWLSFESVTSARNSPGPCGTKLKRSVGFSLTEKSRSASKIFLPAKLTLMLRTKCGGMNITVTLFNSKPVSLGCTTVTSAVVGAFIVAPAGSLNRVLPIRCSASRFGGAEQPPEVLT